MRMADADGKMRTEKCAKEKLQTITRKNKYRYCGQFNCVTKACLFFSCMVLLYLNPDYKQQFDIHHRRPKHEYKLSCRDNFLFLEKVEIINWRKQDKINQKKVNCTKKIGVRCFAYLALAYGKSPCFPTKEPGLEKAHNTNQRSHSCNAGTLPGLRSTLQWKTVQRVTLNCPFLRSKGKLLLH